MTFFESSPLPMPKAPAGRPVTRHPPVPYQVRDRLQARQGCLENAILLSPKQACDMAGIHFQGGLTRGGKRWFAVRVLLKDVDLRAPSLPRLLHRRLATAAQDEGCFRGK